MIDWELLFRSAEVGPWFGWIFGFGGIIATIFFYFRGKREKVPHYEVSGSNIIRSSGGRFADLEVRYQNQVVKNLTLTNFVIWNAGKEPIRAADLAIADPLRFTPTDGVRILRVTKGVETDSANQFNELPAAPDGSYPLSFEFLNSRDGATFHVIHDGESVEAVHLLGTIIGGGKIRKNPGVTLQPSVTDIRGFERVLSSSTKAITTTIFLMSLGTVAVIILTDIPTWVKWILGIVIAPYAALATLSLFSRSAPLKLTQVGTFIDDEVDAR